MKIKNITSFLGLFILVLSTIGCSSKLVITYSLYPYLLDSEFYRFVIEDEWKKIRPDVDLKFIDYNCYHDGAPTGIDVVMYDSCIENTFVEKGYLHPIELSDIKDVEDFIPFTISDLYKDNKIYGIPAILCANLLIYDESCEVADNATCIEDLQALDKKFVINVDYNYEYFYNDFLMDSSGQYRQYLLPPDPDKTALNFIKNLSNPNYFDVSTYDLPEAYNQNICDAYFGYSETLSLIEDRISTTKVKTISMARNTDIPLCYCDVVGMNSSVTDDRKQMCLELMNVICSKDAMLKIGRKDNKPRYYMFPRMSYHDTLMKIEPRYSSVYGIFVNPANHLFR